VTDNWLLKGSDHYKGMKLCRVIHSSIADLNAYVCMGKYLGRSIMQGVVSFILPMETLSMGSRTMIS